MRLLFGAALTFALSMASAASPTSNVDVSRLALNQAVVAPRINPALRQATGPVDIIVQLSGAPLALANGENAHRGAALLSRAQQIAHSQQIKRDQDSVLSQVLALGGKEIARVQIAYNAAIVEIDASKVPAVASIPGVSTVEPVGNYEMALSETVPYIGASAAQALGVDGSGVRVAVLDSGIDYTHYNFGGAGTAAAYAAAYGSGPSDPRNKSLDGLFPTNKVVAGYDFVGETWDYLTHTTLEPDPDPIALAGPDAGGRGHGTHVADIIAGRSEDGKHVGVAPGASLYAYKVCSAVSRYCSGAAILEGIDRALDPNGDLSMDDAVDVINMSIASPYGQREEATAAAAANAVRAGVVVVAAAGNERDKPYVVGSPSSAPGVISVAETEVPSAMVIPVIVNAPASIAGRFTNTATLPWAPITGKIQADVAYVGAGCPTDRYLADPAGKIALVDGLSCAVSELVRGASAAGALAVIIDFTLPGDPRTFSSLTCPEPPDGTCKPAIVVQQSLAESIRTALANGPVNATISVDNGVASVGSVRSSSSRGPSYDYNQIKPDIAAPGASVSAEVGRGTGETPFGGTSGASPMVAGAAALLIQAYPNRPPWAIKSLLMNTADTNIFTNPLDRPGELAPITRIGGGEVRVDQALASTTAAWDAQRRTGSLSFGYLNVSEPTTLVRRVKVENYGGSSRTYALSYSFRYANDNTGAVKLFLPSSIRVGARSSETFDVLMKIDPKKLPTWMLDGGPHGGNGALLQTAEFDGYVSIRDSRDDIHLAWHVLPHKSADVHALTQRVTIAGDDVGVLALQNFSAARAGAVDLFALTGTSPRIPRRELPEDGADVTVTDLAAVGARLVAPDVLQFAISSYGRRAHPLIPGGIGIVIDADRDGEPEFELFNADPFGGSNTGQTITLIVDIRTGALFAYFYADADLDSGNMILTVPLAAVGLTPHTKFSFDVFAYDNYFSLLVSDSIDGMVFTPDTPRFVTSDQWLDGVSPRGGARITVNDVPGGDTASPSQSGLLLMYRDAALESETIQVVTKPRKK